MHDQLFTDQKLRLLTIVDNYTKISPLIGVGLSYKAADVVLTLTLEKAVSLFGMPKTMKIDNGPEFISKRTRFMGL